MGKTFDPLRILKQIDRRLISLLSKKQLKLFLLLLSSVAKTNGRGKLERETIKNFAGAYFNKEDLFVICQSLKKFGLGKLTCCKQENPKIMPCFGENWKDLSIGISFRIEQKRGKENDKSQKTNRRNNRKYEV